ncbi:carbohydrate ABC transporter permease [Lihuaxuella thermophila]|uniref:Multiple sugar transport system permease protein n=1 Tax=Lihuaxuella thermophila TaxID=1173111 RepID=A0A1H8EUY5_9BACL|nr:carbohydrate ABC transporter permease [Lihuaxuella thermophila]SEN23200.1 multiple sugar transport system permease protein [Lihuaxuella thermophila]
MAITLTRTRRKKIHAIFVYLFLIVSSAATVLPLLWMISTSLKSGDIIFQIPPKWIPNDFHWENYYRAVTDIPFFLYLKNTVLITFFRVFAEVFMSAFVAYGFARFHFPGKNIWFLILLSTIMLPGEVTMIPVFLMFSELGWINTFKPLIVPAFFGGQAVFVFLLRQYFLTIPRELEEAALMDGASRFQIFYKIFLPLSKPALITIGIFSFQGSWNDLLGPLMYLNDSNKFTLQLGLAMFNGMTKVEWGPLMAASILVLLPTLIIFFAMQKYFVEGISVTGIKG